MPHSGITFASTSTPTSIKITFQQLDFDVTTIAACHCVNNGEPIDVTGRKEYNIEGLLRGCKYTVRFMSAIAGKDESIEVGRQEVCTDGKFYFGMECSLKLSIILDCQLSHTKSKNSV